MASMLRSHLRSNVVGYVALVVALLGVPTAYAIGVNTIGSKQIKPRSVETKDLATGAVDSRIVENGALGVSDFSDGDPPDDGTKTRVTARYFGMDSKNQNSCKPGEQVIGAGFSSLADPRWDLLSSYPSLSSQPTKAQKGDFKPDAWTIYSSGSTGFRYLICARWGEPAQGPQGPPGPPGEIADQQCPEENMFVYGITDGAIKCAYLNIVG